ncbi:MAG: undecaprenyl/decaprenyl-phosphate alpha-N-acetylglucosaminyl 1-phosphate transferase [Saprospirales bacterium]|nr:undecaprenyl/decaprenyl-phosphate alpha-N-acetylglucosaminyl 1-phosphate transferase [Saprospirales bacterium]MBK8922589.1 undecaprenyl/decaprenyl-phosphate alpha-N-acetylglucosaminyl 1-phosphate transferase [Saprospirales bacterium]
MFALLLGFITAFTLTYLAIPVIIRVAREKKLYDRPNERSAHAEPTPSLGGIAIFAGTICGIILWAPVQLFGTLQYVLAALVIIFLIGIRDDLSPLSPAKKLFGQMLAALILVYKSHVKVNSFDGVFGLYELPELVSFSLSIIAIAGIINAFNLIDGINGLAGSIGLLVCLTLGCWFFAAGHIAFAVVALSLAGALTAFLKYNFTPARIFMGDTGAMLTGAVCALLAIKFIELNRTAPVAVAFRPGAAPAIAVAILILPLFDTLRVITHRLSNGKSPFYPDRSHIHHTLLDAGLTHMQATSVLVALNTLIILWVAALHAWETNLLFLLELVFVLALSYWLRRLVRQRKPGWTDD